MATSCPSEMAAGRHEVHLKMSTLVPVVTGFLLTTVFGGLLGLFFQRRSWDHQHTVQVGELERERAVKIFEEVSRLLDKRLYRIRLLYWSLPPGNSEGKLLDLADSRMEGYREVLYEWNDSINRNLALIQQYFGQQSRSHLDEAIATKFIDLGRTVETLWRERHETPIAKHSASLDAALLELSGLVYHYNISMLRAIQDGSVGAIANRARQGSAKRRLE